jgi:hypothetical protein
MADVLIRVPAEFEHEFTTLWKQLRLFEGLDSSADLDNRESVDRFDGHALAEWVVTLSSAVTPLVTAVLGYLAARRGEVVIKEGDSIQEYRGFSPSEIETIYNALKRPQSRPPSLSKKFRSRKRGRTKG